MRGAMTTTSRVASCLAINGGEPAVPAGLRFHTGHGDDEAPVLASLRQDKHAFGPHAEMLQEKFARRNDNRFCMATNSGTSALHLCVAASARLGLPEESSTTLPAIPSNSKRGVGRYGRTAAGDQEDGG